MDEEMYEITVLVPIKLDTEWMNRFFEKIADAAYSVQENFDEENDNRDWDISCYGTPEKDKINAIIREYRAGYYEAP